MSKSLKNFITIDVSQWIFRFKIAHLLSSKEILEKFTPRQLRLAFLTQLWNAKMDFSETLMTGEVRNLETTFNVNVSISPWIKSHTHTFPELFFYSEGTCKPSKCRRTHFRWFPPLRTAGERAFVKVKVSLLSTGIATLNKFSVSRRLKPPSE